MYACRNIWTSMAPTFQLRGNTSPGGSAWRFAIDHPPLGHLLLLFFFYVDDIEARRWTEVPSTIFWDLLQGFGCASYPTKNILPTHEIFVRPDSPHFPCKVKKSRWHYFLFCHKVSICASSLTHWRDATVGTRLFAPTGSPWAHPRRFLWAQQVYGRY